MPFKENPTGETERRDVCGERSGVEWSGGDEEREDRLEITHTYRLNLNFFNFVGASSILSSQIQNRTHSRKEC